MSRARIQNGVAGLGDVYHIVLWSLHAFSFPLYTCISQMVLLISDSVSKQPELLCLRKHLTIVSLSVRKKDDFYRTLLISAQLVRWYAGFRHDCARHREGGVQLIDLKQLNHHIDAPHFRMHTISSVLSTVEKDYAFKIDLQDAYFHVLRPSLKLFKFGLTRPARQNYRGWACFFMNFL